MCENNMETISKNMAWPYPRVQVDILAIFFMFSEFHVLFWGRDARVQRMEAGVLLRIPTPLSFEKKHLF